MPTIDKIQVGETVYDLAGGGGSGVPAGGETGQVLAKRSATDGDAGWYGIWNLPSDHWWLPAGINSSQVVAVYQFKGALTESAALFDLSGNDRTLTKSSDSVTWNTTEGFTIPGASAAGLNNSTVNSIYSSILCAAVRFSNVDTGANTWVGLTAIGGRNKALNAKCAHSYDGKTYSKAIGFLPGANSYSVYVSSQTKTYGVAAINWTGRQLFVDGISVSYTDTGGSNGNTSPKDQKTIGNGTTYNGGVAGGSKIQAAVFYNSVLTGAQHAELAAAMAAL